MATMKVRWTVSDLDNVMSLFDVQRVWRATSLSPADWVEVTTLATRVPLVAGVTAYLFDHTAGDPSYYYAVSYYNSATTAESSLSDPVRSDVSGYLTVDDIRNEGFTSTMVDDAAVVRGIQRANAIIERVTGQWFEPRTRTFQLDGKPGQDLLLDVPIIAITSFGVVDYRGEIDAIELDDVWVYNRHLTQGLTQPDDRVNPRIAWRDLLPTGMRAQRQSERRFVHGRRNIQVAGVFGYTELDPLVVPAETAPGSQIPVDYGETPALIKLAATLLTIRYMYPRQGGDGDAFAVRARVVSERTRDQAYTLSSPTANDAAYGMTGDIEVDKILSMFIAPAQFGVV